MKIIIIIYYQFSVKRKLQLKGQGGLDQILPKGLAKFRGFFDQLPLHSKIIKRGVKRGCGEAI